MDVNGLVADMHSLIHDLEELDREQDKQQDEVAVLEARCEALAEAVGSLVSAAGVIPPSTGYNSDSGVAYLAMDVDKALRNGGPK